MAFKRELTHNSRSRDVLILTKTYEPITMRIIYTVILYFALPFVLLRLLFKARGNREYLARWNERLGFNYPAATKQPHIWVHAVSMGEALASIPLIKLLQQKHPQYAVVMTTTTPTGYGQIKQHLKNSVICVYTPFDLPLILKRFIRHFNIKTCIIMEREMWPNLIHVCYQHNIPVSMANTRLSERSKNNYLKINSFMRNMLNKMTLIMSQSEDVTLRLEQLGMDAHKIKLCGNIKFDTTIPQAKIDEGLQLKSMFGGRPVLIAASTHEHEESQILKAYTLLTHTFNNLLLILVPRHPARFNKVAELCCQKNFNVARRSKDETVTVETQVYLGDTVGELIMLYAACDIAFVGGSLVPVGGHNLLEPATLGKPIITGPYLHNFMEISELLTDVNALMIAKDPQEITTCVTDILNDPVCYQRMQQHGQQVVANNRGAMQKHLDCIDQLISTS